MPSPAAAPLPEPKAKLKHPLSEFAEQVWLADRLCALSTWSSLAQRTHRRMCCLPEDSGPDCTNVAGRIFSTSRRDGNNLREQGPVLR